MVDIVDKATRSRMMSGIGGKNTKPERLVRHFLHKGGFRFRLHVSDLPGKPDIVLPKFKVAICIQGCFWHAHECGYFRLPASNRVFWRKKLEGNVERDRRNSKEIRRVGWRLLIIWECAVRAAKRSDGIAFFGMVSEWLINSQEPYLELRGRHGNAISGRRSTARAL